MLMHDGWATRVLSVNGEQHENSLTKYVNIRLATVLFSPGPALFGVNLDLDPRSSLG
jgi:hypothetical protein